MNQRSPAKDVFIRTGLDLVQSFLYDFPRSKFSSRAAGYQRYVYSCVSPFPCSDTLDSMVSVCRSVHAWVKVFSERVENYQRYVYSCFSHSHVVTRSTQWCPYVARYTRGSKRTRGTSRCSRVASRRSCNVLSRVRSPIWGSRQVLIACMSK